MEIANSLAIVRQSNTPGAGGGGGSLFLDTYIGATLAFSTRKLSSSYTGACLRVKRSSDNAEQDIGFVADVLDTASLSSFVGVGDGRVVAYYDQSGNGNDITPGVVNQEPLVYQGGSLVTAGGKPCLVSDGVTLTQLRRTISLPQAYTFSLIAETSGSGSAYPVSGANTTELRVGPSQTFRNNIIVGNFLNNTSTTGLVVGNLFHQVGVIDGATSVNSVNSNAEIGSLGTSGLSEIEIFPPNLAVMKITELIIFGSNQESNRVNIQTDVNTFYSIY